MNQKKNEDGQLFLHHKNTNPRRTIREKYNNSSKEPLIASKKRRKQKRHFLNLSIIGIVIGSFFGVFLGQIINSFIPTRIDNKSDIQFEDTEHEEKGIESKKMQINIENINYGKVILEKHTGIGIDNNIICLYCEEDENSLGSTDLSIILNNTDNYEITLEKIEVRLLIFAPISKVSYRTLESVNTGSIKQDELLYCLIDPLVQVSEAYPVGIAIGGKEIQEVAVKKQKLEKSIMQLENNTYSLKIRFTDYGLYVLKIRARYYCNGNYLYSDSRTDLRIIYDKY